MRHPLDIAENLPAVITCSGYLKFNISTGQLDTTPTVQNRIYACPDCLLPFSLWFYSGTGTHHDLTSRGTPACIGLPPTKARRRTGGRHIETMSRHAAQRGRMGSYLSTHPAPLHTSATQASIRHETYGRKVQFPRHVRLPHHLPS